MSKLPLSAMHLHNGKQRGLLMICCAKRPFANQLLFRGGIKDAATEYQYIKLLLLTDGFNLKF
jgi:hypothetical protein